MLNTSIETWYSPQKRLFRRVVSLCFTFAGIYWLIIYGLVAADMLSVDELKALRGGQTMIYFILLTIWGVEYLREARRLKNVITLSNELGCPPQDIQAGQIGNTIGSFAIISGFSGAPKTWIIPGANLLGLTVSASLILIQYLNLFQAATK